MLRFLAWNLWPALLEHEWVKELDKLSVLRKFRLSIGRIRQRPSGGFEMKGLGRCLYKTVLKKFEPSATHQVGIMFLASIILRIFFLEDVRHRNSCFCTGGRDR